MNISKLYHLYATSNLHETHYKVLFLLLEKDYTQTELSNELTIAKQNINKICKDLSSMNLIITGKIIGRNKYLAINLNPNIQLVGQINMLDSI